MPSIARCLAALAAIVLFLNVHAEEPVGVGTTVRLTNAEAVGAALICEGKLVHLSLFAKETPRTAGGEPGPNPIQENQDPPTGPNVSGRSWWRSWA